MSKQNPIEVLSTLSNAISQVTETAAKSVVRVSSGGRGGGTGVVWSKDGYILTCSHVVMHSDEVEVGLPDGRALAGKIVGHDPYADVALLKVEAENLTPIQTGDSEKLRPGQFVLALANAFGGPVSVTSGIVTSPRRSLRGWWGRTMEDVVITDAPLNPGYSGGPLVDAEGRMIGLNSAFVSSRGIAVPVNKVVQSLDRLKKNGRIKRAYLGIVTEAIQLPEEIVKDGKLEQETGLMVVNVVPDSPARKGGLLMGDVILSLNKQPISSLQDLHQLLDEEVISKPVSVQVLRSEKTSTLSITPSEAQEQ